ncbi:hypothetical protein [Actinophytocola sp.]|uniref:hypothetical protein n=1 Tax=Actinophytocola sp. TaxID=1872138 RepID=UPI003D6B0EB7
MPPNETTDPSGDTGDAPTPENAGTATSEPTPAPTPAPGSPGSLAELPEWAQTEIRRARTEAAKYRRERNTAQKALQDKDTAEHGEDQESRAEIDRLSGELTAAQRDAARLRAALAADVPPTQVADFAARLVGDTDEDLAADAQRLRELLGLSTPPDRRRADPSQGAGLDTATGAATSPAEAFAAFVQDKLQ